MGAHRIERVNERLKREISRILVGEVLDPRVDAVTVTGVSTAPDLTLARVFVQLSGEDEDRRETMKGLRAATPFIRSTLAGRVEMRRVPELRFEPDTSLEHALRIERLLEEAGTGDDAPRSAGESGTGDGEGGGG